MKSQMQLGAGTSLAGQILDLPRLMRISLVLIYSLSFTLLLFPLVDSLYLTYFYTPDTVNIPALLSAVAGILMYLLGWRLMVGYAGERPPERMAVVGYLLLGTIILLMVITLFVIGAVIGSEQ